jgi:hypothetical protein
MDPGTTTPGASGERRRRPTLRGVSAVLLVDLVELVLGLPPKLLAILRGFRLRGVQARPVLIGSYRNADAVSIPAALAEKLAPLLEDLAIAERVTSRRGGSGAVVSGYDIVARLGLDETAVTAEHAALLAELRRYE